MTTRLGWPSHVTLTNPYCWPHVRRGSESLVHGLARWLDGTGVRVEVAAGGPSRSTYELDGVRYVNVRAPDLRRVHRDLDAEITLVPGLAWALRRLAPDLVHAFLYGDAVAARSARRPYVVSYGGIPLRASFRGRPLKRRLFAVANVGARAVICPSDAAARHFRDQYGVTAEVVPNGLDVSRFRADHERRDGTILCAATPDDVRKRPEVAVDALGLLLRGGLDAELTFAGAASAQTRARLEARLPEGARHRLRFVGEVGPDELARLYGQAAVSCLPSLHEAFGMVVVESLAAGTPVVGTDHGAIPELLTAEVGRTFPPDDAPGCAAALSELLTTADDEGLRAACRARAREFDWAVVGPRYLELYARVA